MSYVQYSEPYPGSRGDTFGATAGRSTAHRGQDTAPGNLPALSPADGVIVRKLWSKALGNVTVIAHADGKFTGVAHTATASALDLGARVARLGSIGAQIGNTGTATTGRHCHYTLGDDVEGIISGHVQDPLAYFAAHSNPPTTTSAAAAVGITFHPEEEVDDMPLGYYAKGNKASDIYWIDQRTGKRRPVSLGEWQAAREFNVSTGGATGAGFVAELDQAVFDAIPKV